MQNWTAPLIPQSTSSKGGRFAISRNRITFINTDVKLMTTPTLPLFLTAHCSGRSRQLTSRHSKRPQPTARQAVGKPIAIGKFLVRCQRIANSKFELMDQADWYLAEMVV